MSEHEPGEIPDLDLGVPGDPEPQPAEEPDEPTTPADDEPETDIPDGMEDS